MAQSNRPSRIFFAAGASALVLSMMAVNSGHAELQIFNPFGWGNSSSVQSAGSVAVVQPLSPGTTYEEAIIASVKRAEPAVVSVIISRDLPRIERFERSIPFEGPFNSPFYEEFDLQIPELRQNGTIRREVGGGTAFFVSADGVLMTNRHVVEDPRAEYSVLLNDGRTHLAKVHAMEPTNDIALLKVEGSGFTPLPIVESDALSLGQTAIAIGNAMGEFRNTVSVGVVSGLSRSITAGGGASGGSEQLDQIIQTDAAINVGNSGGPLLNSRGEVIGMNTAVAQLANNIGFALPAKELRRALQSYKENGRIVAAFLGVRYTPITQQLKTELNLAYDDGVLISSGEENEPAIIPGSPADHADLQENDIILEVDGQTLTQNLSLAQVVHSKAPGQKLELVIDRGGTKRSLTVTLGELKEEQ